jgi:hypothetical protein
MNRLVSDHQTQEPRGKSMSETIIRTCVAPSGEFVYGIHKPQFSAVNLRQSNYIVSLGKTIDNVSVDNIDNFPEDDVRAESPGWVFEIPNAFPFMGATFISKSNADRSVGGCNPFNVLLNRPTEHSSQPYSEIRSRAALLSLASTCTDPGILAKLAEQSCRFTYDERTGRVSGMEYEENELGKPHPIILDHHLFEIVSNNPSLPNRYKRQMVLIPGAQGISPIVGEYTMGDTHVWEYLRDNSYIPWGHYTANMAHDAVRYKIKSLTQADMTGLRHLYYQRIYVQLEAELGLPPRARSGSLTIDDLENSRLSLLQEITKRHESGDHLPFNAILWGQNFGFDLSSSGYRLAASHQQVHQQFALVQRGVKAFKKGQNDIECSTIPTYTQADLVTQFAMAYRKETNRGFFETYLKAIKNNKRLDGREEGNELVFYHDENVIAFVPKAQRSQGEVQIMTKEECGNIIETDTEVRSSLDKAILLTMKMLENLGVEMLTALEISKRLDNPDCDQRLLYCFLPRHPRSPGGFSELQQRWITNHYPEDFAQVCREEVQKIMENDV